MSNVHDDLYKTVNHLKGKIEVYTSWSHIYNNSKESTPLLWAEIIIFYNKFLR